MAERIEWADALKGFLILMVVLGHSIQSVCQQTDVDFLQNYFWNLIYSFHMPAFMAVSGYLAFKSNGGGYSSSLISSIYRRFRQLMVPFLLWSVIMYLVNHNVEHLYEYVIYPNKSYWFLWALFFIVCLFNIAKLFSNKLNIKEEVLLFGTAAILVGLQLVIPDAKLLGVEYVSYYFFYYILAYFLHKYEFFIPSRKWILIVLAIVWFALGSFYKARGVPEPVAWIPVIPGSITSIAYRMITALVFILLMFGVAPKIKSGTSRFWQLLLEFGKLSLGIYVVHMVVRMWLVKGLLYILPSIPYWGIMIITFVLLSVISILTVKLLNKNKITSEWFLGKI